MTFKGKITKIIYEGDNGWALATLKTNERSEKVVGIMPGIHVDAVVEIEGEVFNHPKYKREIQVKSYKEVFNELTEEGILNYLKGNMIKGIGKVYAERIVAKFGLETFNILNKDPDRLLEVRGIGKRRLKDIKEGWAEQSRLAEIQAVLSQYNVSLAYAYRIYEAYGADAVDIIQEDPYRLADDIDGIGFKKADDIALGVGFAKDSPVRLRSGILFVLNSTAKSKGDCYLNRSELVEEAKKVLETEYGQIENALKDMIDNRTVVCEDGRIYSPLYYFTEVKVANRLSTLMKSPIRKWTRPSFDNSDIEYEDTQKTAIEQALNNPVFYITGGPGTGKTTIMKAIIHSFGRRKKILLAAPTGRAAKRMSEATGCEAKTIHRTLEWSYDGPHRTEENKLEGDVLIVDECSMIDLMLMNTLLNAVPDNMRVILVGDANQLPSVGPGNVLHDIIESDVIPGVKLTHIFRQAEQSQIIVNAHKVINGQDPEFIQGNSDFLYSPPGMTDEETADRIVNLCINEIPARYGIYPGDIQILGPRKDGDCGVNALNEKLQRALNPGYDGIKVNGCLYKEHDKVMQIRNDYKKNVFNGDIGFIISIDEDYGDIIVSFDGGDNIVEYSKNELTDLKLAYASTIHKSQGSEYDAVIIALPEMAKWMSNRNLLYTAITRAKKLCVLIGEIGTINIIAHKKGSVTRNTTLTQRLCERNEIVNDDINEPEQIQISGFSPLSVR